MWMAARLWWWPGADPVSFEVPRRISEDVSASSLLAGVLRAAARSPSAHSSRSICLDRVAQSLLGDTRGLRVLARLWPLLTMRTAASLNSSLCIFRCYAPSMLTVRFSQLGEGLPSCEQAHAVVTMTCGAIKRALLRRWNYLRGMIVICLVAPRARSQAFQLSIIISA